MLGRAWRELLTKRNLAFTAPPHSDLDITNATSVAKHLKPGVRTVINCAAWTDVDAAEQQSDGAIALNGYAAGGLMKRCAEVGAVLMHYSTDYVFQGESDPIPVDESREPINGYGRSKEIGEELVQAFPGQYILIRTSWLYAPWGRNFVRTIAKLAREKSELKVVNDQRGRPSSAEHLAAASFRLLECKAQNITSPPTWGAGDIGAFHVTDGGECTWFEFASEIAKHVNPACRVLPCTTAEFPRPAKRPAYSVLDISETEKLLGSMPHWKDNLSDVLRRLE